MKLRNLLARIYNKSRQELRSLRLLPRQISRKVWKWQLSLARFRLLAKSKTYRRFGPKPSEDGWSVLRQMTDTQKGQGLDGKLYKTTPFVTMEEGQELHDALLAVKPKWALETGFGHGYSTLYMLQALAEVGHGKMISVDPGEFISAQGVGLMNVRKAGLERFHVFWNENSQFALPRLCHFDLRLQFAFIDSSHLFDYTIVEFFYLDKLLSPGGMLVFHDYVNPSVYAATKFIEANHSYAVKPCLTKNLRMFVKQQEDSRPWFYFVPFRVPEITWRTLENRTFVSPDERTPLTRPSQ